MQDFGEALSLALGLVLAADPDLIEIIALSLRVSLSALAIACILGLPIGAAIAMGRFRGPWLALVAHRHATHSPPEVSP